MTSQHSTQRIAIIGAGTSGLAAASFLAQQSHHVTVFETVHELKPVGAGLLLQPSGLAVLDALGVGDIAREHGASVTGLVGTLPSGSVIVNSFYQDAGVSYEGLGMHRATLCHVLQQSLHDLPVDWQMGKKVVAIEPHSAGARVIFQDILVDPETERRQLSEFKVTMEFDLVLVCNGARSTLRPKVWTAMDKPYPWGAIWAIVPECDMLDKQILHQFYDSTDTMMGILPTGSLPEADSRLSSVFWSLPAAEINLKKQILAKQANTQRLIRGTKERWPHVAEWLAQQAPETQWLGARYRDVVMTKFGQDSIGVLGDAAHAMSPQLGQGANMALLDAWAISHALATTDNISDMWQVYHRLREPSIRFYQRMSRALTPFYQSHSQGLGKLRDLSFRWMYQVPWLRKQMALTVSGVKTGLLSEMDLAQIQPIAK